MRISDWSSDVCSSDLAGVGSFTATFEVTNNSAADGAAQFDAEAKAVETTTAAPDVECDPSDADNIAVATDDATVTVEDAEQVILAASDSLLDEADLEPTGSDQTGEPTGARGDVGTHTDRSARRGVGQRGYRTGHTR